jgi:hypothetical protein
MAEDPEARTCQRRGFLTVLAMAAMALIALITAGIGTHKGQKVLPPARD